MLGTRDDSHAWIGIFLSRKVTHLARISATLSDVQRRANRSTLKNTLECESVLFLISLQVRRLSITAAVLFQTWQADLDGLCFYSNAHRTGEEHPAQHQCTFGVFSLWAGKLKTWTVQTVSLFAHFESNVISRRH